VLDRTFFLRAFLLDQFEPIGETIGVVCDRALGLIDNPDEVAFVLDQDDLGVPELEVEPFSGIRAAPGAELGRIRACDLRGEGEESLGDRSGELAVERLSPDRHQEHDVVSDDVVIQDGGVRCSGDPSRFARGSVSDLHRYPVRPGLGGDDLRIRLGLNGEIVA